MQAFDCVLFDTEFTAWEGSNQRKWSLDWEHRELIQLAAVRVHVGAQGVEIISTFNELIKPQLNPTLSDYICQLTGIQQPVIDDMGIDFESALKQFYDVCQRGELSAYSWGNDFRVLAENCNLYNTPKPPFEAGFSNLQQLASKLELPGSHVASGELAQANGVSLEGHKHNALYDVRSLAVALNVWIQTGKLNLSELRLSERLYI